MLSPQIVKRWTPTSEGEIWKPTTLDQLNRDELFLEDILADCPELMGLESQRSISR